MGKISDKKKLDIFSKKSQDYRFETTIECQ